MITIEKRKISISDSLAFMECIISVIDLLGKNLKHTQMPFDIFRKEFGKSLTDADICAIMGELGIPVKTFFGRTKNIPVIEYEAIRNRYEQMQTELQQ